MYKISQPQFIVQKPGSAPMPYHPNPFNIGAQPPMFRQPAPQPMPGPVSTLPPPSIQQPVPVPQPQPVPQPVLQPQPVPQPVLQPQPQPPAAYSTPQIIGSIQDLGVQPIQQPQPIQFPIQQNLNLHNFLNFDQNGNFIPGPGGQSTPQPAWQSNPQPIPMSGGIMALAAPK
jgi:hypothetical protein